MPSAKFIVKNTVPQSFRNEKVKGMFDVDKTEIVHEFDVNIPIENKDWNIGVIVGASGSGKTTIAKKLFSDYLFFDGFQWDNTKTIIDNFSDKYTPKQITEILSKVGFSSAPDWLKPFNILSNGQKMRVELAKLLLENSKPVLYDEFTSVVDRQVAQVGSNAISKYVKKENKQFIALSCHYDILEWLEPDWVYDVSKNEFQYTRGLLRRPEIKIDIRKAVESEWKLFKKYHYLSSEHNTAAHKYIAEINGVIVGWCSVLHFPHPKVKNLKKIHRIVILPDYQGLGIGNILLNTIAEIYQTQKMRVSITTSTPVFINSLQKSQRWIMTAKPQRFINTSKTAQIKQQKGERLTATFTFKG